MSDTPHTGEIDPAGKAGLGNHAPTRLAWSLWATCVALIALALLLEFLTYDAYETMGIDGWIPGIAAPIGILSLVYPTMGR